MYEKGLSLEFVDASFISSESKTLNLVDAKKIIILIYVQLCLAEMAQGKQQYVNRLKA